MATTEWQDRIARAKKKSGKINRDLKYVQPPQCRESVKGRFPDSTDPIVQRVIDFDPEEMYIRTNRKINPFWRWRVVDREYEVAMPPVPSRENNSRQK